MASNIDMAEKEDNRKKQTNSSLKKGNQQHSNHRYRYSNARYSQEYPQKSNETLEIDKQHESIVCVCCLYDLRTYVTYSCMHHVCLHCSLKMRIVCEKLDCPICRQISTDVICTKKKLDEKLNFERELEKYIKKAPLSGMFYYITDAIKVEYEQLLGNFCRLCDTQPQFKNLDDLEIHLKRMHKRFFCDLCLKYLKLFPFERKFYNREELAQHRREGDLNDQSFKGIN
jgi:hypothetical protein